ncbi:MAG: hypothetical protein AB7V13_03975 [Pseudorhodoplanes sp.]|uniref:hypothetical protein n=1 Tax=Pseudorhodoplanes sp. TaxID=1934341 RepID=UPI003D13344A
MMHEISNDPPVVLDSDLAAFFVSRAALLPSINMMPLSDALFEYDLDITGQPRGIRPGKSLANIFQMVGREDGRWLFVLPILGSYRVTNDRDHPTNTFAHNTLVHIDDRTRIIDSVCIFAPDAIDILLSDFRVQRRDRTADGDPTEPDDVRGSAMDNIRVENQRRVAEGIAQNKLMLEARGLAKWAKNNLPKYFRDRYLKRYPDSTVAEEKCANAIYQLLRKMRDENLKVICS